MSAIWVFSQAATQEGTNEIQLPLVGAFGVGRKIGRPTEFHDRPHVRRFAGRQTGVENTRVVGHPCQQNQVCTCRNAEQDDALVEEVAGEVRRDRERR